MEALFAFAILLFFIGPILAIVALVKISNLENIVRKLRAEIAALEPSTVARASAPVTEAPIADIVPEAGLTREPDPEPAMAPAPDQEVVVPGPVFAPPPPRNVEQALASRWLVWLGGAAIAIGGLLFIKYAHDNGLIPPIVRVLIGWAAAAALIVAAEWMRRRAVKM